jgi:hypothetical protein
MYVWSNGDVFNYCHSARLWENIEHKTALQGGQDVCYRLAYDTNYATWRFQMADCNTAWADGASCWGDKLFNQVANICKKFHMTQHKSRRQSIIENVSFGSYFSSFVPIYHKHIIHQRYDDILHHIITQPTHGRCSSKLHMLVQPFSEFCNHLSERKFDMESRSGYVHLPSTR